MTTTTVPFSLAKPHGGPHFAKLMQQILIIEDDDDIAELLHYNLEREGFKVYVATNGELGLKMAGQLMPNLIILDLMLPGLDGLSICRALRANPAVAQSAILILSAKGEESDVVVGLELGADDYVTKPFSPKELLARVRALLRRPQYAAAAAAAAAAATVTTDQQRAVGPVMLDFERHEAQLRGHPLYLTLAEYRLLSTLLTRPGRVFSREQLLEKITGGDTYVIDRNVDVHIRAIRRKLGVDADFIVTVRGVGYKCRE